VPAVAVSHCRDEFLRAVAATAAFIAEIPDYLRTDASGRTVRLGARRTESLTGLALLRLQLSWETLVEDSYYRYLCGAQAPSGVPPRLLQQRSPNLESARRLVIGSASYVSWAHTPTTDRARVHFQSGEPYVSALAAASSVLSEMAIVRNRLAHSGDYAADRFSQVVRSRLGYVPRGMTPGRFLLAQVPGTTAGSRYIDVYVATVRAAGHSLVPS
jgi:hypothetical protein